MNKQKHGKRYNEEQIIRILDEVRGGKAVAEVARSYGVSENTIYRWKSRFGEMSREEEQRGGGHPEAHGIEVITKCQSLPVSWMS